MDYMLPNLPDPEAPVLVIGGAGVDVIGRMEDDAQRGSSIPARIRTSYGGVARNVAENLARLGHSVNLITVVGNDEVGEQLLAKTAEAGVNLEAVMCVDEFPTGFYLAVVDSQGKLELALDDMHVMEALTPEYIREQAVFFKNASMLFLDANLPKKTLRTTLSLARKARLPVCADPTSTILAERLLPYLPRLTLITPNSAEAAFFCKTDYGELVDQYQAVEAAKHLVSQGVGIAIITMAELGLCYATSEMSGYIPAIRTPIVDPNGAGDALSATVIFALLNEIPLDDAVRLGVSAASLTLRYPGAVVPDLSIEKLYDELVI